MEHGKTPGADVLREFGILIFLSLILCSEAGLQTMDGPSHLEAPLGQNVTLPCVLTDSDQPQVHLDLQTASVRWDMRSVNGSVKKIYLLTSGIHEAYRPKYNIEENDFRRGIASLSMQDVLEGDEGEYTCSVYITPDKFTSRISVQVSEQPTTYWERIGTLLIALLIVAVVISLFVYVWWKKAPQVSMINGAEYLIHMKKSTLHCSLSYFKSKKIKINVYLVRTGASEKQLICFWRPAQEETERQNDEALLLRTPSARVTKNLKAKVEPLKPERKFIFYSCPCNIHITPDIETDDGAELIVEVKHFSLKTPISVDCRLRVNGDCLKLQPIRAPEHLTHGQEVTLTCNITKYSPGSLHIEWLKKDLLKQKESQVICENGKTCDQRYCHSQEERQDGRVFTVSSSLTFMANVSEDHGKKYICRVFYPALGQDMESALDSYVRAVPVLEPITSKLAIPSAGQQMELSCNILSFHPRELTVEWYKEDDLVPQTTDTKRIGDDGLYSVTSTLNCICAMEDLGKIFKCKVVHESLKDPQILEKTLGYLRTPLDNTQDEGPL